MLLLDLNHYVMNPELMLFLSHDSRCKLIRIQHCRLVMLAAAPPKIHSQGKSTVDRIEPMHIPNLATHFVHPAAETHLSSG